MSLYVNTDDLKAIANEIDQKKQGISDLYQGEIKSILKESENVIVSSGLDFNELTLLYDAIFYNLDAKLYNICHVLSNKVAPSYDNLSTNIAKAFNEDFANQMKDLMY